MSSFDEVKSAYNKIKEANLSAAHIPCAYRLIGVDFPLKQDFADGSEIGAGRVILNTMKAQGLFNLAIFIVHYYDGEHIGPKRFAIMQSLSEKIIASFNGTVDYGLTHSDQGLVSALLRGASSWLPKRFKDAQPIRQ